MNKKQMILLVSLFLIIATGSFANAALINFSNFFEDGSGFHRLGSITHEGFKFSSSLNGLGVWQDMNPNHPVGGKEGASLLEWSSGAQTSITEIHNNPFNLYSIDLSAYGTAQTGTMHVKFTGIKVDNSRIEQIFTVNNPEGSTPELHQFLFHNFTDLLAVNFTQGTYKYSTAYQFNNLSISSVPIPGAAWLLGSGLLGIAGIRIRKKERGTK